MVYRKFNRGILKKNFLESKEEEVKKWFESVKKVEWNSYVGKKTKGWSEEKKGIIKDIQKEAYSRAKKELPKKYAIDKIELLKVKRLCLDVMIMQLHSMGETASRGKNINIQGLLRMFTTVKNELGEPLQVLPIRYETPSPIEEEKGLTEKEELLIEYYLEDRKKEKQLLGYNN